MLLEQLLSERLGSLSQLKVGPMINILKQQLHSNRRNREDTATAAGSKFGNQYQTDVGAGSEVVDFDVSKKGITDVRKAYREHEDHAKAFALYVNGKAVLFAKIGPEEMRARTKTGLVAYDLSMFQDQIERENEEQEANRLSYSRQKQKITSYSEKERKEYRSEKVINEKFFGEVMSTAALKELIDNIVSWSGGQGLSGKIVLRDRAAQQKRNERYGKATQEDIYSGLDALQKRLAQYKVSKKPTATTIEAFLDMTVKRRVAVVQFAGRGYKTTSSTYDKVDPTTILNGKPFSVDYKSVDPGSYDSIKVFYIFDKDTGALRPWKATWTDGESRDQQTAALQPETFLKQELGIRHLDKDTVLRSILTQVKDGTTHKAKQMIAAARKAGADYPEFKAIERSLEADAKAKAEQEAA